MLKTLSPKLVLILIMLLIASLVGARPYSQPIVVYETEVEIDPFGFGLEEFTFQSILRIPTPGFLSYISYPDYLFSFVLNKFFAPFKPPSP